MTLRALAEALVLAVSMTLAIGGPLNPIESALQDEIERLQSEHYSERLNAVRNLGGFRDARVQPLLLRHALDPNESTGVVEECLDILCATGDEQVAAALLETAEWRSDQWVCAKLISERIERGE